MHSGQHIRKASALTTWRKSSYSGASNGNCVEVSDGYSAVVPVRDSKNPEGPALVFGCAAWSLFVTGLHQGKAGSR
ncbi:DUF397 domain-containing protein [Streptomyces tubbatahanensis]|uniref:DUF397 domain-containing protein n=1 Tax=Streptomyces tubbatahanensis TaxID=2923272 RepID=A0ABY3XWL6_9ACTN|nr:DUF397 domain-containing protein [Streptomyces tubbatahanensis]UNS98663.1 DUF397 domain-containing protein [Streptomyces tubbatahanensis]